MKLVALIPTHSAALRLELCFARYGDTAVCMLPCVEGHARVSTSAVPLRLYLSQSSVNQRESIYIYIYIWGRWLPCSRSGPSRQTVGRPALARVTTKPWIGVSVVLQPWVSLQKVPGGAHIRRLRAGLVYFATRH